MKDDRRKGEHHRLMPLVAVCTMYRDTIEAIFELTNSCCGLSVYAFNAQLLNSL